MTRFILLRKHTSGESGINIHSSDITFGHVLAFSQRGLTWRSCALEGFSSATTTLCSRKCFLYLARLLQAEALESERAASETFLQPFRSQLRDLEDQVRRVNQVSNQRNFTNALCDTGVVEEAELVPPVRSTTELLLLALERGTVGRDD